MKKQDKAKKENNTSVTSRILIIIMWLVIIQSLFLGVKQLVFSRIPETLYSRSMVTMASMLAVFLIMVLYCRHRGLSFSVFPKGHGF